MEEQMEDLSTELTAKSIEKNPKTKPQDDIEMEVKRPERQKIAEYKGVKNAVKPIFTILSIFGMFHQSKGRDQISKTRRHLQIVHSMVCNGVYWAGMVKFISCFKHISAVDGNLLLNLTYGLYFIAIVFGISAFTLTSSSALPEFVEGLQKMHEKRGVPHYVRNGRKKVQIVVTVVVMFGAFLVACQSYALMTSPEAKSGKHCTLHPVTISQTTSYYILAPIYGTLSVLVSIAFMSIFAVFIITSFVIWQELSLVSERMQKIVPEVAVVDMSRSLENVRLHYEHVVDLLQRSNRMLSAFFLLHYALLIPLLCLNIYALATEVYSVNITIVYSFQTLVVSLSVGMITIAGIMINSKAHRLVDTLLQTDYSQVSDKTARSLKIFLTRLIGTNVGLSAGGLFLVDKTLLLTMVGAIVTYTVVVFQFKLS